ncbi:MAG: hypothetical protein BWY82_00059 [Verrucomicrobia bacterium ADurb.Bin474]|nr:MAG: hypothetical protein BWY82_00059 [Verrucomicrobia bacterium ADurb.Bin474]
MPTLGDPVLERQHQSVVCAFVSDRSLIRSDEQGGLSLFVELPYPEPPEFLILFGFDVKDVTREVAADDPGLEETERVGAEGVDHQFLVGSPCNRSDVVVRSQRGKYSENRQQEHWDADSPDADTVGLHRHDLAAGRKLADSDQDSREHAQGQRECRDEGNQQRDELDKDLQRYPAVSKAPGELLQHVAGQKDPAKQCHGAEGCVQHLQEDIAFEDLHHGSESTQ